MDDLWVTVETRLWNDFMNPPRRKLVMHSLSPEDRREARMELATQKEREFGNEWRAYEKWLSHVR